MNQKTKSKPPVWESAHQAALNKGEDFYIDPETGYRVWTRAYLEKRGHCCDSRCRHCPYGKVRR